MKLPFDDLLKQAKGLQERFERMQEELVRTEVTGVAGGGLVRVTMSADHAARRVQIDPSLFAEDHAMLEDLVTAAINDAARRVEAARKEKLGDATAGLPLPPGFKFPFGA